MQEIVKKINDKLKPSGWYDQLRIFLDSSDFSDIIGQLKYKVEVEKQRFCPALNTAFRFMEETPFGKLRAIMFIDYACNRLDQADGVPLSAPDKEFHDKTPTYLFQSIDGKTSHDVNNWIQQGLLIVPLALTSRIDGKAHKKVWEPLLMRLIETVNKSYPKAPCLLVGTDSWKYEDDLVSPAIRRVDLKNPLEDREWHKWLNENLKAQGKRAISW